MKLDTQSRMVAAGAERTNSAWTWVPFMGVMETMATSPSSFTVTLATFSGCVLTVWATVSRPASTLWRRNSATSLATCPMNVVLVLCMARSYMIVTPVSVVLTSSRVPSGKAISGTEVSVFRNTSPLARVPVATGMI